MAAARAVTDMSHTFDMGSFRRRVFTPVSIAFVVLAMFFSTTPDLPAWVVIAPFAVSVLVLGLPHGALDHLVPARLAGRRPTVASIATVAIVYLVLAVVVLLMWRVAPATAFVGFIALTWFHWGQGDLWIDLAEAHRGRLQPRLLRAGTVLVRGGLPMLVPLLFHPDTYERVRLGTIALFGQQSFSSTFMGLDATGRGVVGIVYALVVLATALATWRTSRTHVERGAWAHDQMETVVLALFFALGPPVLTVGLYFCLWHSLRHIVRLELLDPRGAHFLRHGQLVKVAGRFAMDAAPITTIAVLFLGAIYCAIPPQGGDPETVLAPYLVLISALTVPHVAVVSYMDFRQGVWSRASGPGSAMAL
ncbi:Brp/Blh family beta-carotene 15,15'-dioxygenase [Tessaracoccus antarcticus]|nr:Brp/Blh family beta-carotene 15,15'-dioxygenase [Tessaracoccus antarcticus]